MFFPLFMQVTGKEIGSQTPYEDSLRLGEKDD